MEFLKLLGLRSWIVVHKILILILLWYTYHYCFIPAIKCDYEGSDAYSNRFPECNLILLDNYVSMWNVFNALTITCNLTEYYYVRHIHTFHIGKFKVLILVRNPNFLCGIIWFGSVPYLQHTYIPEFHSRFCGCRNTVHIL